MGMKRPAQPDLDENVNRVVNILLARDGMNRADLADTMGYNPSTVTRALKGERKWTLDDIAALASVFKVSVGLFFDDPDTLVRNRCFLRRHRFAV